MPLVVNVAIALSYFFAAMAKKEKADFVQQDKIHIEMIKKEENFLKLHTEFSINPFRKLHILPDKPMSKKPPETIAEDTGYIEAFHRAHLEPSKKYPLPLTESQEIGWYSTPLIPPSRREDNFHRVRTDVTKHAEHAQRLLN